MEETESGLTVLGTAWALFLIYGVWLVPVVIVAGYLIYRAKKKNIQRAGAPKGKDRPKKERAGPPAA